MNRLMPRFALALSLLGLISCSTRNPNYQIRVGNAHSRLAVEEVHLIVDGEDHSTFSRIAASKEAASAPRSGPVPKKLRVRWTDASGKEHDQRIDVKGLEADPFRGNLICEITADNQLTFHAIPSLQEELSVIPWASPESWEGSIGIPGMGAE